MWESERHDQGPPRGGAFAIKFGWGHSYLGLISLARDDCEATLSEMQQETTNDGQQEGVALVYHALGRKMDSDAALARLLKEDENAFGIARVYAFRGLDRAYAQRVSGLYHVKGELPLKTLEAAPRVKAFLHKMNLPE
jgi:hypothetical protein